jgi:hypothetical protein
MRSGLPWRRMLDERYWLLTVAELILWTPILAEWCRMLIGDALRWA